MSKKKEKPIILQNLDEQLFLLKETLVIKGLINFDSPFFQRKVVQIYDQTVYQEVLDYIKETHIIGVRGAEQLYESHGQVVVITTPLYQDNRKEIGELLVYGTDSHWSWNPKNCTNVRTQKISLC